MRSFNMGRFGSDDPWFRVGTVDVNTTVFVVGAGVLSMLVWAIEGPARSISKYLVLDDRVMSGQVWRLFTWPFANQPDFWTLILFAVFFMLGSQLESAMGRRQFAMYLLLLTVIPGAIATLFGVLTGADGAVWGLRPLELGVLVAFGVRYPTARFWPGVPAWGIAGFFVALELLQSVGNRNGYAVVLLLAIVAVAILGLRAMGFADEAHWIPKLPLPASMGGEVQPAAGRRPASTSRRKKRGRAKLSVAPPPASSAPRKELSRLEEAEMDSILDQVSERGMDSLTPQQRQRLEDHSKRLRRRDS